MSVLAFLMADVAAGWLVGVVMKGHGLLGHLYMGIKGALIGGYLLDFFAVCSKGSIVSLITATAGAILVLAIAGLVNKRCTSIWPSRESIATMTGEDSWILQ